MKLGTRLTLYLSLVIVLILSGYGVFHVHSRRQTLMRLMRIEVRSIVGRIGRSVFKQFLQGEEFQVRRGWNAISSPGEAWGMILETYHDS